MQIKLTVDYRGKATQEMFYPAGTLIDVSDRDAEIMIASGKAVAIREGSAESTKQDTLLIRFLKPAEVGDQHYEPDEIKPIENAIAQMLIDGGFARVASLFEHETAELQAKPVQPFEVEEKSKPKRKAKK